MSMLRIGGGGVLGQKYRMPKPPAACSPRQLGNRANECMMTLI